MPGMLGNQPAVVMNRWQHPGDVANFQKFSQSYDSAFYAYVINSAIYGDNAISDASFIRLKNAAISYSLPQAWQRTLHMKNARVYIEGENLLTFTNYFGLDPETQTTSLPPLRTIVLGIHTSF